MMAVIVGVMQTVVATREIRLNELQTKFAEVQVLPRFELSAPVSNEGDASWIVTNYGAPVREFTFAPACFLVINSTASDPPSRSATVPVNDCIQAWGASNATTGVIADASGFGTIPRFRATEARIQQVMKLGVGEPPNIALLVAVRLRYRDLIGRPHEDYMEYSTLTPVRVISKDRGAELFRRWQAEASHRRDLGEITASDATSLLNSALGHDALDGDVRRGQPE